VDQGNTLIKENLYPEVLAIIPARGGSKRFPRKNLALLNGKSLVGHAITACQAAGIGRIIVSTDDTEIAEEAKKHGAPVPWMRPPELAEDNSASIDVILHAVKWAVQEFNPSPEFAVLIEPTAPLRQPQHIQDAISKLKDSAADIVMSVNEVPHIYHPEEVLVINDGELFPYKEGRTLNNRRFRKDQKPVFFQNGIVYAMRVSSVMANRNLYGDKALPMVTDQRYFADIDNETDLRIAEHMLGYIEENSFVRSQTK
jgi:CMP-N,N'-diacetyllegionaminic acid synthase